MQEAELHDLSDDAGYATSQQQILKEVEQMSSSFAEAFPAMQETLLEFRAGKMLLEGKKERAGNLTVPNLGVEAISEVTSSLGPVKLEDLQRILSSIGPTEIAGDPAVGDFLFFAIFNGVL
ncbi:hypothetical protein V6N13_055121 [Hibiscus sabdariffa]|uniref:Uncharacterized protein n=1 Tax=Hibiscus sabdariffa TaxID=183260 RepID=A0ABR2DVN4_9ROSI